MTTNIDRAAEVIADALRPALSIADGIGQDLARRLADAGTLRPPASERYTNTITDLPSFSAHEDSPVDGPHIEASIEKRYRKGAQATVARVYIDLDGEHGSTYMNFDTNPEWCRVAASILLDVADALETIQEKE